MCLMIKSIKSCANWKKLVLPTKINKAARLCHDADP